jgi:hypothetical protein
MNQAFSNIKDIFVLADILDFSRLPDEQLVEILKCRVSEHIDIL